VPTGGDLANINAVSREGFTGQDIIGNASMGLVHLNGRVQDAITGRSLSADPAGVIADPTRVIAGQTQSWDRFSYVMNNPLSLTDPTGFADAPLEEITVAGWKLQPLQNPNEPHILSLGIGSAGVSSEPADTLEQIIVTGTRHKTKSEKGLAQGTVAAVGDPKFVTNLPPRPDKLIPEVGTPQPLKPAPVQSPINPSTQPPQPGQGLWWALWNLLRILTQRPFTYPLVIPLPPEAIPQLGPPGAIPSCSSPSDCTT
jgi:RHS repeat-associated protein